MARAKRDQLDILSYLPAERRQAIVEEALGGRAQDLFRRNSRATLGQWVASLVDDELWDQLQHVRVDAVLRSGEPTGRAPAADGPPGRRGGASKATLDQIVEFIRKKPGLRSEQIQRETGLAPRIVKKALAQLRKDRRVKTSGERRATTYAAS